MTSSGDRQGVSGEINSLAAGHRQKNFVAA
jgi:hypothetical protein